MSNLRRPHLVPVATLGTLVASPVATWGLIPPAPPLKDPDYFIEPAASPTVRLVVGIVAALVLLATLIPTIPGFRSGAIEGEWGARVFFPFVLCGLLTGWTMHVYTVPEIGANIGAGLMTFFVLPFAVIALGIGWLSAAHLGAAHAEKAKDVH